MTSTAAPPPTVRGASFRVCLGGAYLACAEVRTVPVGTGAVVVLVGPPVTEVGVGPCRARGAPGTLDVEVLGRDGTPVVAVGATVRYVGEFVRGGRYVFVVEAPTWPPPLLDLVEAGDAPAPEVAPVLVQTPLAPSVPTTWGLGGLRFGSARGDAPVGLVTAAGVAVPVPDVLHAYLSSLRAEGEREGEVSDSAVRAGVTACLLAWGPCSRTWLCGVLRVYGLGAPNLEAHCRRVLAVLRAGREAGLLACGTEPRPVYRFASVAARTALVGELGPGTAAWKLAEWGLLVELYGGRDAQKGENRDQG